MKPLLAITMGDINGVGPELIAKAFARGDSWAQCRPVVLGNLDVYNLARARIADAPSAVAIQCVDEAATCDPDALPFLECDVIAPRYRPGSLDAEAGRCAMQWLDRAVDLAMDGAVNAIVTCPINKQGIHAAGYTVRGHTDYIASKTNAASYRMCLFTRSLGIIHISDHVPLSEAVTLVKRDRIIESIRMGHDALARLGTAQRRIAVAGLNPHAGEAGAFGSEEADEILPAIEACRAEGIDCTGPHSPDALFRQALEGAYDVVIAMYHDQGHIPLKLAAMDEGVNVTLGLPIVRTSVDHGTAYDIAGKGLAREDSLCAALTMAARLTNARQEATS